MTGLVPHAVEHAVGQKTVLGASQSYAVISLTVLIVVLLEREALRIARVQPTRLVGLTIAALPLLVAVALTLVARVALVVG
jgi:hypothetical protein